MKKILVRYGELTLKGNNRNFFITRLYQNIKFKLKPYRDIVEYKKDHNSLTLNISDETKVEELCNILKDIFGIHSLSIVEIVDNDLELIKAKTLEIAQSLPAGTFKLEVSRKDKRFPLTSPEVKQQLAPHILVNTEHLTVDVHKPQSKIDVVIKTNGTYIFTSKIQALKGLPVGVSGKAISLLSGGIDSPVASYLTLKRGMQVDFLHFMTPPHTTKEALDKVFELSKKIAKYNLNQFSLYVCDFSKLLQELMHMRDESYRITLMRRAFMRIANLLADKMGARAIVTGESLGQVASQTIESINVINEVSKLPIIRPVITYDKEEIIDIAYRIDTYQTSILPFDDVCSMYVPKQPVTKPRADIAQENEDILLLDKLLEHTVEEMIVQYVWKDGEFHEYKKEN